LLQFLMAKEDSKISSKVLGHQVRSWLGRRSPA
jgi:hypothetical protein